MGFSGDDIGRETFGRAPLSTVHVRVARDFKPFPAPEIEKKILQAVSIHLRVLPMPTVE